MLIKDKGKSNMRERRYLENISLKWLKWNKNRWNQMCHLSNFEIKIQLLK